MEKNNDKFLMASIALLKPSETNPRKIFNELELQELAESIKQVGIINPITVRRSFDDSRGMYYEIVSGERRYRAAKLAGLTMVPVIIRDLSDEEVLEVQIIENLQRNDVHPMDEAYGFKNLLAAGKYNISALAEKVGKSETYVYQRLKLLDLIPEVQEAYMKGELVYGHVVLICRLQKNDQERAYKHLAYSPYGNYREKKEEADSPKELSSWINRNILLDLHKVGFKKDDINLNPEAGSCIGCSKRTGFNKHLFPELDKHDYCTDPLCFQAKLDAFVSMKKEKLVKSEKQVQLISTDYSNYGPNKNGKEVLYSSEYREVTANDSCEYTQIGLIADGIIEKYGKTINICSNKKCKIHYSWSSSSKTPEEKEKEREQKRAIQFKEDVNNEVLTALVDIIPFPFTRKEIEPFAEWVFNHVSHDFKIILFKRHGWDPKIHKYSWGDSKDYETPLIEMIPSLSDEEIFRLFFEITFLNQIKTPNYQADNGKELRELAASYDINISSIEKSLQKVDPQGSKKQKNSPEKLQDSAA